MLLTLDQFVFGMDSLPFRELQRQTQYKHRGSSRVGARDASQYLGPGEDLVTITGVLVPEITGRADSLRQLRDMAEAGDAYVLVDATGLVHGAYVIEAVNDSQDGYTRDGQARRIDFTIGLKRVDDRDMADQEAN